MGSFNLRDKSALELTLLLTLPPCLIPHTLVWYLIIVLVGEVNTSGRLEGGT